jgi:hypothetical protein
MRICLQKRMLGWHRNHGSNLPTSKAVQCRSCGLNWRSHLMQHQPHSSSCQGCKNGDEADAQPDCRSEGIDPEIFLCSAETIRSRSSRSKISCFSAPKRILWPQAIPPRTLSIQHSACPSAIRNTPKIPTRPKGPTSASYCHDRKAVKTVVADQSRTVQ